MNIGIRRPAATLFLLLGAACLPRAAQAALGNASADFAAYRTASVLLPYAFPVKPMQGKHEAAISLQDDAGAALGRRVYRDVEMRAGRKTWLQFRTTAVRGSF